jgi:N-acetylmuramoyl-L-alanine amidase
VRDLQRRLGEAGFAPTGRVEAGSFCPATEAAVVRFQRERGLSSSGECDEHTWKALVEATWKLGDRMLVLTSPNVRGDDVVELQTRLGRLGFHCGRVDGILGPLTARAVEEFQANCGLHADGVFGAATLRALDRVSSQTGDGPGVASLREQEHWRARATTGVTSLRVVIGQFGGASTLTRLVTRDLRVRGAEAMSLDEPDAVTQAVAANRFGADVYVGVTASAEPVSAVSFYRVPAFESIGGRALAELLVAGLRDCDLEVADPSGMRLPVLRETKMPAALITLGPVRTAIDRAAAVAERIVDALERWTTPADPRT